MLTCCYFWIFLSLSSVESLDHFLHQNSHPRGGWASRGASKNPWYSLTPMSSTTSTYTLSMSTILLIAISANITSASHLSIGSSIIHTLHSIIDITGSSWGPGQMVLLDTLGHPGSPSGLCFLLHSSIHNSSVAFLYGVYCCCFLGSFPCPSNRILQIEFNVLCISIEKPSLHKCLLKNRIASPIARTTALVMWSLVICQQLTIHSMHGKVGVDSPSPSPESLLHEYNNASNHDHGGIWVNPLMLEGIGSVQRAICLIMWTKRLMVWATKLSQICCWCANAWEHPNWNLQTSVSTEETQWSLLSGTLIFLGWSTLWMATQVKES